MRGPMTRLKEVLLEIITNIESIDADLDTLRDESLTLTDAVETIQSVIGDRWIIQMQIIGCNKPTVQWSVWDGKQNFIAATLAGAVNLVIINHKAPPAEQVDKAQETIQPMPF